MSAALRAYAEREAKARSDEQHQGASEPGASGNNFNDADAPFVGKRVLISNLVARPDLNGKIGEAESFSSASGRYAVNVAGEQIALRATNLSLAKANARDAEAFTPQTRVKIKGLSGKPELNGCGGTVLEWNEEKERFVVELDGSLQKMLLRAANLERDRRERWVPEMHTAANLAHIAAEQERYVQEQWKNANPFAQMFGQENADMLMKQQEERNAAREAEG